MIYVTIVVLSDLNTDDIFRFPKAIRNKKRSDFIPPLENKVFLFLMLSHFLSVLHVPEFESFSELFDGFLTVCDCFCPVTSKIVRCRFHVSYGIPNGIDGFDNPGMSRFFARHRGLCLYRGRCDKKDKATIAAYIMVETECSFIPIPSFRFIFRLQKYLTPDVEEANSFFQTGSLYTYRA